MSQAKNQAPKIGPAAPPQGGFEFGDDGPLSIVPQQLRTLHDVIESLVDDPLEGACETEIKTLKTMKRLATQLISLRRKPESKLKDDIKVTADHRALMMAADSLSKKIPQQEGREHALFTTLSGALQNLVALKCPPSLKVDTVDTLEEIKSLLEGISPLFLTDYKEKNRLMSALQGIRGIIRERETGVRIIGKKRRRREREEKAKEGKSAHAEKSKDAVTSSAPPVKRKFRSNPGAPNFLMMPAIKSSRGGRGRGRGRGSMQYTQPNQSYMNSSYEQPMPPSDPYMNSSYQQPMHSNENPYTNSSYQQNQMPYYGGWNDQSQNYSQYSTY